MNEMREYRTRDKSGWGAGAWQDEPDKVQWIDDATGLDCLIVRGPAGALCGYVGVPETHPWHGKEYGRCVASPACEESYCGHSPGSRMDVHGGLTYAESCCEASRENWNAWRTSMHARREEAAKHPQGDSARAWNERGHLMDDYEAWVKHTEASAICHIPEPGRPAHVWWFGFDCAHSGDLCPEYGKLGISMGDYETYKGLGYVRGECERLAGQLAQAPA